MKKVIALYALFTLLSTVVLAQESNTFMVGYGKTDITYIEDNLGLFGYGDYNHRLSECASEKNIHSRLYSRVISILDPVSAKEINFVHLDYGTATTILRKSIIQKIKSEHDANFDGASLMLTVSHTHNAPGGYSQYALYMAPTPGYNPDLVAFLVDNITASIIEARSQREASTLEVKQGVFANEVPVAYNRALNAFNNNPDKLRFFERTETNLAINRTMPLLNFKDLDGNNRGLMNWFGVHPIEIGIDSRNVDAASKGYAAISAEEAMPENTVAIFAQSSAGDVMTADQHNPEAFTEQMNTLLGAFNIDESSTPLSRYNGNLQSSKALEIQNNNAEFSVSGGIDYETIYIDLADIKVKEKYNNGDLLAKTFSPAFGYSQVSSNFHYNDFHNDTYDILKIAGGVAKGLRRLVEFFDRPSSAEVRYRAELEKAHSPKEIFVDAKNRTLVGLKVLDGKSTNALYTGFKNILSTQDPVLEQALKVTDAGAANEHTLVPTIIPIQIFIIGNLAVAGIPGEITTTAYNRLQTTIQEVLQNRGVEKVVISSYANEYMGYTTTFEEYQDQRYEAGHTLFGKHQLGAIQTKFEELATEMLQPKSERILDYTTVPPVFSDGELSLRSNITPLTTHPCGENLQVAAARAKLDIKQLEKVAAIFSRVNWEDEAFVEKLIEIIDFENIQDINQFLYQIDWKEAINVASNEIIVFPNPSSESIRFIGAKEMEQYTIYSLSGKEMNTGLIAKNQKINIQHLAKGVYFVKLGNGFSKMFVRQ